MQSNLELMDINGVKDKSIQGVLSSKVHMKIKSSVLNSFQKKRKDKDLDFIITPLFRRNSVIV